MTIRRKLVAILVVPLAALVGLALLGIRDRNADARSAREAQRAVTLASSVAELGGSLEQEMIASAEATASGSGANSVGVVTSRLSTDSALTAYRTQLAELELRGEVAAAASRADQPLDALASTRGAIDAGNEQSVNALTLYHSLISRVLEVNNQLSSSSTGSVASTQLAAHAALGRAKHSTAVQLSLLGLWVYGRDLDAGQTELLQRAVTDSVVDGAVFAALASAADAQRFSSINSAASATDLAALRQEFANGVRSGPERLISAEGVVREMRAGERTLEAAIDADAAERVNSAVIDTRSFMVLAGAALAFALLSASMFGRSISRPITQLTKAARRVSNEHLPRLLDTVRGTAESVEPLYAEPLDLGTRDELGELASAFNAIQATAVSVAGEHADMIRRGIGELFVNLARRNQSLLDRQIGFLDELEAHETDPDVLADLFRLDHLATRMRRNAESLLVLAGTETPRRWGKPVALSDVVRAAIGEVEDFARINIVNLDERSVHGAAAADVAHLLAELLDNASQYSPPNTEVEVHGAVVAGGYRLVVRDHGIGMTEAQRLEANTLLVEPPRTGLHLSRSLGFTVVGRLAQRHGVVVELHEAADAGLLVTVAVPAGLLVGATEGFAAPTAPPVALPSLPVVAAPGAPTNGATPSGQVPSGAVASPTPSAPPMVVPPVASPPAHKVPASGAPPRPAPAQVPAPLVAVARRSDKDNPDITAPVDNEAVPELPARQRGASLADDRRDSADAVASRRAEPIPVRGRPDDVPAAVWARLIGGSSPGNDRRMGEPSLPTTGWAPSDPPLLTGSAPPDHVAAGTGRNGTGHDLVGPTSPMPGEPSGPGPATLAEATASFGIDAEVRDLLSAPESPVLGVTSSGLPRRRATDPADFSSDSGSVEGAVASQRSPEEIRSLLSSYRGGLDRGRRLPSLGATDEGAPS